MNYAFLSVCLLSMLVSCQEKAVEKQSSIRVAGEGKVRVMPNLVNLTLDVYFVRPRMIDAVKATQETIDTVNAILQKFAQQDTDIKTSSVSANKEYNYTPNGQSIFIGFKAQQSIDFVLKDITRFTDLTGRLLETRINSISQIQFGHQKADSLFREADLLAYDDALRSATKLCSRANVQLGQVVYISNNEAPEQGQGFVPGDRINTFSKAYGGRGFTISPEVLEFKRIITAEYRIAQ